MLEYGLDYICCDDEVIQQDFVARQEQRVEQLRPMEFGEAVEYYGDWVYYDIPVQYQQPGVVEDLLAWCEYSDDEIAKLAPCVYDYINDLHSAYLARLDALGESDIPF